MRSSTVCGYTHLCGSTTELYITNSVGSTDKSPWLQEPGLWALLETIELKRSSRVCGFTHRRMCKSLALLRIGKGGCGCFLVPQPFCIRLLCYESRERERERERKRERERESKCVHKREGGGGDRERERERERVRIVYLPLCVCVCVCVCACARACVCACVCF